MEEFTAAIHVVQLGNSRCLGAVERSTRFQCSNLKRFGGRGDQGDPICPHQLVDLDDWMIRSMVKG